ncbi:enoyl-CoA hydratase/isomerase family protein [Bacillus salipaludis]|uniref:Enoyl-CoA hydratase/isomerase family protein n=1 Tax=Bacillus salipaludis TaxID=2547811 RepID=A0ABW8RP42_9BACI
MAEGNIQLEKNGHIATIRINRPEKLNSMTVEMAAQLSGHVREVNRDKDIRAVVFTGNSERAFSSGSDIKQLDYYETPWDFRNRENEYARLIKSIRKPVIAAIKGYCLGGGLEMAVMADIRIGSYNSSYGASEVNWGWIGGGGNSQMLPRIIGPGRALEMLLTGDIIPAEEAYRLGLIDHLLPDEEVEEKAYELANKIAEKAPIAIQVIKHAVRVSMNTPLDVGMEYENELVHITFSTEDKLEGESAFKEKRRPVFKGR